MGRSTGLEPATLGTTNRCSNQLSYDRHDARLKDAVAPLRGLAATCKRGAAASDRATDEAWRPDIFRMASFIPEIREFLLEISGFG